MRKVTIKIDVEIDDGRGVQEVVVGLVDRVEEAVKEALPI